MPDGKKTFQNAKRSKSIKMNRIKKIKSANVACSRIGLENAAAAWTIHLIAPLFAWKPVMQENPAEPACKMIKSKLIQGELFPELLADGSLQRPQTVAFLEA